jgi:threonine dehydratase
MPVTFADIHSARVRLRDVLIATPVLPDERLSQQLGAKVFLKAECTQRAGSFKVRGAYNKISRLSAEERARGVIAHSAGNHAQGVALAAQLFGVKATIVMPERAPLTKVLATQRYGSEVVLSGATFDDAGIRARVLQQEHGYTYVHAFNDEHIIAGQGTLGLEIVDVLSDVNTLVVPIGGGGLISGIAIAARELLPQVRLIGVQAAGCSAVKPSLQAGYPIALPTASTIADGIAVKRPGDITLPIIQKLVDDVIEVDEDDIARAIAHCVQNMRLVVEGAGAAGVAALLAEKVALKPNEVVCAPLCGGNIDANLLSRVLEQVMVKQGRYVVLRLLLRDQPGALAALTECVAKMNANVVEVFHRRALWLAPLSKVGIELVIEVRDDAHGQAAVDGLRAAGYSVQREDRDLWVD